MSDDTILVVDDDPKMRKLLRACFEAEGFGVVEAGDGAEALAAMNSERPFRLLRSI